MRRYLIYGLNGAGKSTIGEELKKRGYTVIDADHHEGLSSWVNKHSGQKAKHEPPFPTKWFDDHEWMWDETALNKILDDESLEIVFVDGNAQNLDKFMDRFDKRFFVYAPFETALLRLKKREPDRWLDGSADVERLHHRLSEVPNSPEKNPEDKAINNSASISEVIDEILMEIDV